MARLNSNSMFGQATNENQNIRDVFKCGFIQMKLIKDNEPSVYHRYWAIFYVINDTIPILELFNKEQPVQNVNNSIDSVFKFNLKHCNYVSVPILNSTNDKENNNEFVINSDNQLIQILVDNKESNSKELLNEWVELLRNKLSSLNVFLGKDNIYSKEPMKMVKKNSYSAINRPLPPIPSNENEQASSSTRVQQINNQIRQNSQINRTMERMLDRLNGRTATTERQVRRTSSIERNILELSASNFNHSNQINDPTTSEDIYEHLAISNSNHFNNPDNTTSSVTRDRSNSSESFRTNSQVLSLRESQVFNLKREIANPGGVKLRIRKIDCLDSLAFVEWLGRVFVAGWKQKLCPQLHNTFHLGDQIVLINGSQVTMPKDTQNLIKNSESPIIEFIIRRLPFGKIWLIKRKSGYQDLGLIREGNSAEILFIEPNSLAHKHGIPNQTRAVDPLNKMDVNWAITEINFRPLSLFFKGDEIKNRLNSVGPEISILLQPVDLIKNIKKQLKLIKNYKDYIVQ